MTERTRKHPVQFYLSDDEQYILDEKFRLSKMRSKSAFLRKLVLYGFVYDVDYSHIREMNALLLGSVDENLNYVIAIANILLLTIVTPLHPMLPGERRGLVCADGKTRFLCYAKPVEIGSDCWFGANVVVCPGVTVGQGCVIGAGSVVTRDIPPNSFAAGVPARVIRPITQQDAIANIFPELY